MREDIWHAKYNDICRKKTIDHNRLLAMVSRHNDKLYRFLEERGLLEDWYEFQGKH